jgi:hypothetical protein
MMHRRRFSRVGSSPGTVGTVFTQTINGQDFALTFDQTVSGVQSVDGSWLIVPPASTQVSSISPTPNQATVNIFPSGTALRWIDGAMKNIGGQASLDQHALDERFGTTSLFNASLHPTFPLSVAAGDRLILSKSVAAPTLGYDADRTLWQHSAAVFTFVSALPATPCYRPSIWEVGTGNLECVPRVPHTSLPTLTLPGSPKLLDGTATSFNWSSAFSDSFDSWRGGVGIALQLAHYDPGIYRGIMTQQCFSRDGYNSVRGLARRLLRARVDSGLSSDDRQAIVDQAMQYIIDLHGLLATRAAGGGSDFLLATPNGGHVQVLGPVTMMLAELLRQAGQSAMAQSLYDVCVNDDTATVRGNSLALTYKSFQSTTAMLKSYTTGNRSTPTTFNSEQPLTTANDTSITFSNTVDWASLIPAGGVAADRRYHFISGNVFQVKVGGTYQAPWFAIKELTTDPTAWGSVGGNFGILGGVGDGGFAASGITAANITHVRFAVAPDAMLNFYPRPTGYNDQTNSGSIGADEKPNGISTQMGCGPGGGYEGQLVGIAGKAVVLTWGLTSPLWTGTLHTTPPLQRVKDHWEFRRLRGTTPYYYWRDYYPSYHSSFQALYREFLHDGNGLEGLPAYVLPIA